MKPRIEIEDLSKIPNVGPATIRYLNIIGINTPFELVGQNPYTMYRELCEITGKIFDPCLADAFISAVRFMGGEPPQKWWYYTKERKEVFKKAQPESGAYLDNAR